MKWIKYPLNISYKIRTLANISNVRCAFALLSQVTGCHQGRQSPQASQNLIPLYLLIFGLRMQLAWRSSPTCWYLGSNHASYSWKVTAQWKKWSSSWHLYHDSVPKDALSQLKYSDDSSSNRFSVENICTELSIHINLMISFLKNNPNGTVKKWMWHKMEIACTFQMLTTMF